LSQVSLTLYYRVGVGVSVRGVNKADLLAGRGM
jgi:hypothetical protein